MANKSKPTDHCHPDNNKNNKSKSQQQYPREWNNGNHFREAPRRPRSRGNNNTGYTRHFDNDTTTSRNNTTANGTPTRKKTIEANTFGTGIPQLDNQLMQLATLSVQPSSTAGGEELPKYNDEYSTTARPTTHSGSTTGTTPSMRYSPSKQPSHPPPKLMKPRQPAAASMTVVVHRVNLVDGWKSPLLLGCYDGTSEEDAKKKEQQLMKQQHNAAFILPPNAILAQDVNIAPCSFTTTNEQRTDDDNEEKEVEDNFFDSFGGPKEKNIIKDDSVAIVYAPVISSSFQQEQHQKNILECTTTAAPVPVWNESSTPFADTEQYEKYWAQRKRLFSRFDEGIQMGDAQGWYSVTPEAIADHVARRMGEKSSQYDKPMVLLDAFCGCGGNAIAFGKLSPWLVSLIVCCDISLDKLRNAANNAAVYGIPPDKLIFIHHDSLHIMSQCYKEGTLQLPSQNDNHVEYFREEVKGYTIGNSLEDLLPPQIDAIFIDPPWGGVDYVAVGGRNGYDLSKDMKLLYGGDPPTMEANGFDILAMAAKATQSKLVIYDVPKNTNKISLARAAISAGYRGNIKLEEYYLNGRLKTATAFLGWDYHPHSSTKTNGRNHY